MSSRLFAARRAFAPMLVAICVAIPFPATADAAAEPPSLLITGASIADGTGAPLRSASVRLRGAHIVEVGELTPAPGEAVLDASGRVLAPGFVDTHNHSDTGLETEPLAETQISQGITTVLLGQDGGSPWPLGEYLERRRREPPALNVAICVGHATVRKAVMGEDYARAASADEVAKMETLVERGFDEGASCLSTGIEYVVGSYATTDEVVTLASVAARKGGFYISHIRDEADNSFAAMQELVTIGQQAKLAVQNTHIKLGTTGVWGKAAQAVAMYQQARRDGVDVTADWYPYDAWHSNMKVIVPSKRWDDPVDVKKAIDVLGGAGNLLITAYEADPGYADRTLAEVAASRGITPVELYIEMVRNGDADIIGKSMQEGDMRRLFLWPWTMVSSDGGIGMKHPRGAGTYPRVLGYYVREQKLLALEEAVRKMTSLPAWRLRLMDRGIVKPGNVADLVLFDAATVIDNSTYEEPFRLATGIEKVWVSGELVWSDGKATGARPGRVLQRR